MLRNSLSRAGGVTWHVRSAMRPSSNVRAAPHIFSAHSRITTHKQVVSSRSVRTQATGEAATNLPNPLPNMSNVFLTRTTNGTQVDVPTLTQGKTLCWEQAKNMVALKPMFDAAGYKLVVVSIGTPEGGRQFCAKLPFPEDLLYLDADRQLYKNLELKDGFFSFWSPAATVAWQNKDIAKLRETMGQYTMIAPKDVQTTTQQGGLIVVDGGIVRFAYQDPGVGAHAPNDQVLAACCSGVTSA